jgi:hypothetical protein
MSPEQKKALLGVAIAICLIVSADRIYKFYLERQPPFAVGECFSIDDPQIGNVKFQVVENDKVKATTAAVGKIENIFGIQGANVEVPVKASFQELRDAGARKVDCK